jgi:RIO kinase 1
MSGKEAMVFVVRAGGEVRCAKVYKEADKRSFRQAVDYTENRKAKNSRQARAMAKGTRYGRQSQERAWQSAEVDALAGSPRRAFACPSRTTSTKACSSWSW